MNRKKKSKANRKKSQPTHQTFNDCPPPDLPAQPSTDDPPGTPDPSAVSLPDDEPTAQVLAPHWVASFTVYWQALSAKKRAEVIGMIRDAMQQSTDERIVLGVQQALRKMKLVETQILRLVLTRHWEHLQYGATFPGREVAAEVLATLEAIPVLTRD